MEGGCGKPKKVRLQLTPPPPHPPRRKHLDLPKRWSLPISIMARPDPGMLTVTLAPVTEPHLKSPKRTDTAFPIKTQSPPQSAVTQTPNPGPGRPAVHLGRPFTPDHKPPSGLTPQAPQPRTPLLSHPNTQRHLDPFIRYLRGLHTHRLGFLVTPPPPSTSCTSVNSSPPASPSSLGAGQRRPNGVGGVSAEHRHLDFRFPRRTCLRPRPRRIQGAAIFQHLTYKKRNSRFGWSSQGRAPNGEKSPKPPPGARTPGFLPFPGRKCVPGRGLALDWGRGKRAVLTRGAREGLGR